MPMKHDEIQSLPSTSSCILNLKSFAFAKNKKNQFKIKSDSNSTCSEKETELKNASNCHFVPSGSFDKEALNEGSVEGTMATKNSCAVIVVSDSESEIDPAEKKHTENEQNTALKDDFKSKLRQSFNMLSKGLIIPTNTPSVTKAETDDEQDDDLVPNNLSARIQKAYCSLSSPKKWQRLIVDSSDEESQTKNIKDREEKGEGSNAQTNCVSVDSLPDCDLKHKEKCLGQLRDVFPKHDFMELQDVLVEHDWSVEKSIEDLSELNHSMKKRKCVINSDSSEAGNSIPHNKKKNIRNSSTRGVIFVSDESDQEAEADMSMRMRVRRLDKEKCNARKKRRKLNSLVDGDVGDDGGGTSYCLENDVIYDSDASDIDDAMTPAREIVLSFFETAKLDELLGIPSCSKRKAELIINMRPFKGWVDLITKFQTSKGVSTDLINGAKETLNSRKVVTQLMKKCEELATTMEKCVSNLLNNDSDECNQEGHLKEQPRLLNPDMKLAPYQMLGLNWLVLVHQHRVNGILADEMGLGKTIQAIAFLTHLMCEGDDGPYLIVVPASTLDNWVREIMTWWPSAHLLLYRGSQEDRRYLRQRILKGKENDFNVLLTTYTMVSSNVEDRSLFKKVRFHYVVFDEAHLLKNMETQRYQHLIKIKAKRRLLLTGTPLQNNLVELMSLLVFVMPNMFDGKIEHLKSIFASATKGASDDVKGSFERDRIDQAKLIMKPFVLRRLKRDVLDQLPKKTDEIIHCALSLTQREQYDDLIFTLSQQVRENRAKDLHSGTSGIGMMMQLRKLANHSLLLRYHYNDKTLRQMAKLMLKEPSHWDANVDLVFEDMQVMSDFELHKLCEMYRSLSAHTLGPHQILSSGKFLKLNSILSEKKSQCSKVLLFSQFVMVLDIIEEYMKIQGHSYLRLDGSTPVVERQELIDKFSSDDSIFIFLLSTRAGGLGINLTAANTVVLHDIDFNPYNDKQAEDRCHRIGQTKDVQIIRLISKDTIEEGILSAAQRKLKLERDITSSNTVAGAEESNDVASLLKEALGL